ncbi:MAG: heavy-metal-associated domain-containing protein [Rhodanobacteraceae bacterium]
MKRTDIQLRELPSLGSGPVMEDALLVIRGVREVKADPDAGRVTVLHDENVSGAELVQAIRATGVAAELAPPRGMEDAT